MIQVIEPIVGQWEHKGYIGGGNVQPLLDSCVGGVAAVCGSALGCFDELDDVLKIVSGATVFAVNDVGVYLQRFHHWVSLHYERLEFWRKLRDLDMERTLSMDLNFKTHSEKPWGGIDYFWLGLIPYFGLSGLYAAQIAYLMGFDLIILCGCPMDETPRFFDHKSGPNYPKQHATDGWMKSFHDEMKRRPDFKKKMRSMSGYTREFLGGL